MTALIRDWQPAAIHGVKRKPEGANGTCLNACEALAEVNTAFSEQFAGAFGFSFALFRQLNIPPTGKTVLQIPFTLSVTHQRKYSHWSLFLSDYEGAISRKVRKGRDVKGAGGLFSRKQIVDFRLRDAAVIMGRIVRCHVVTMPDDQAVNA